MSSLSLHQLVQQTIDEFPETADPGILADKVFGQIPEEKYGEVVRATLRSYVRRVMAETRPAAFVPDKPSADPAPERSADVAVEGTPSYLEADLTAPVGRKGRSSYREAMQAGVWRARLGERIHGATGWLLLRDCGIDDLRAAAAERRDLAAKNVRSAEQLELLQTHLVASGVDTVGDLPDRTLQSVFDG